MKTSIFATLAAVALAVPAYAQTAPAATDATAAAAHESMGDADKGEKEFKKCKACHMIQAPDGTDIVKGGKTGPNLYGVVGRKAGTEEGFKYSDALIKLGEAGEVWTPEDLEHYITDPNSYVQEKTGDDKLKTKMTFKLNKNQADVVAFLAKNSPDAGGAAEAPAADATAAPASN